MLSIADKIAFFSIAIVFLLFLGWFIFQYLQTGWPFNNKIPPHLQWHNLPDFPPVTGVVVRCGLQVNPPYEASYLIMLDGDSNIYACDPNNPACVLMKAGDKITIWPNSHNYSQKIKNHSF